MEGADIHTINECTENVQNTQQPAHEQLPPTSTQDEQYSLTEDDEHTDDTIITIVCCSGSLGVLLLIGITYLMVAISLRGLEPVLSSATAMFHTLVPDGWMLVVLSCLSITLCFSALILGNLHARKQEERMDAASTMAHIVPPNDSSGAVLETVSMSS